MSVRNIVFSHNSTIRNTHKLPQLRSVSKVISSSSGHLKTADCGQLLRLPRRAPRPALVTSPTAKRERFCAGLPGVQLSYSHVKSLKFQFR